MWRGQDPWTLQTSPDRVEVSERTIGKWLRKPELTRLQPRPFHPKKDDAAQAAYKKPSPTS
jgi:Winged helix-turn helix